MLNITNYQQNINQTTMRYDITSIIMTMIFNSNICNKCYGARGEIGTLVHCWLKGTVDQAL